MAAPRNAPLRNITRDKLEPVWSHLEISTDRIAAALGVTRQGLSYKARALGLPPRTRNRVPQKRGDDDLFSRMWMAGVSSADMASFLGYSSPSAVATRRKMMGLPPRTRRNGSRKHAGWVETISLTRFFEMEMAREMGVLKDDGAGRGDAR